MSNIYHTLKVVENELADNKYSEYLMKLFKNRDLQSKTDKTSDEKVASKTELGKALEPNLFS